MCHVPCVRAMWLMEPGQIKDKALPPILLSLPGRYDVKPEAAAGRSCHFGKGKMDGSRMEKLSGG